MLASAWAVSGPIPPATRCRVLSVPSCPERYSMGPTRTRAENGRSAGPAIGTYSADSAVRDPEGEPGVHPHISVTRAAQAARKRAGIGVSETGRGLFGKRGRVCGAGGKASAAGGEAHPSEEVRAKCSPLKQLITSVASHLLLIH